ncbi:uncharacterized protein MONBRDRAFT_21969 [Monosiga brevicollis MX1]|uniref:Uncharacterized protein n=1 Tax=Monosiga brevicollis TaxID=81824 RepID=A9UP60_MONBE|nr:uncharacterized protein MONBRDRAFT_21969 [Monosiga brevicollis MX1]EDQ92363.1 predicted protein [Monosiga brevicollis MX1]|eukprot:XP_001742125.1 hypothetical protein [Monosiga brevicollis MX1]
MAAAAGNDQLNRSLPKIIEVQAGLPALTQDHASAAQEIVQQHVALGFPDSAAQLVESKVHKQVLMLDNPPKKRSKPSTEAGPPVKTKANSNRRKEVGAITIPATSNQRKHLRTMESRLARADFHGARITVVRHKSPGLVGVTGIVLQETENTLRIITPQDELQTLPKSAAIFGFELGPLTVNVYGNNLRFKPSDRAVRKFKLRDSWDL